MAIKALVFDVFGTVVDWRGSIIRELKDVGKRYELVRDWGAFADDWRQGYHDGIQAVLDKKQEWLKADDIHLERLRSLRTRFQLQEVSNEELLELNNAWHRLAPWPDSRNGLRRLRRSYTIATLSNGNRNLLLNMARSADLPWDEILCAEDFRSFKPDPAVYLGAAERLGFDPKEVMLVAAHLSDLRGAKNSGLRTAFIPRPDEFGDGLFKPDLVANEFVDLDAADFQDLAVKLKA